MIRAAAPLVRVGTRTLRGTPPKNNRGETYSPPTRTPTCRQLTTRQWLPSSVPIRSPRFTASPATRVVVTGSKDESTDPGCASDSTGRSTTKPAKCTTPSAGAYTAVEAASTSMPDSS